jgi:DNA mismatch repair protein MutS
MNKKPEAPPNIMNEYIDLTKEYQQKYGEKTIVLLQVGAFFEVYGLKHIENGNITESQIEEFSQICQLNISEKKITFREQQVVMAGFRDYTLDKYLQKLTDNEYTAVVYVQEKEGKTVSRVFYGVYSAGTYISYDTDTSQQITNNIMCIWIDSFKPMEKSSQPKLSKTRETIIYGVATVNIFTGKSSIFEHQTPMIMNPTTFDELERYVSVFSPSEIIFLSPYEEKINQSILQYAGVKTTSIHRFDTGIHKNEKVLNCTKQKYINHILSVYYGEETYNICKEFQHHTIATQAFCFLLNFIQEHNSNLVRNISIPQFNNTSDRMVLANHTLKQLNIIDDNNIDSKKSGHLSSVLSFLNKCCSPMGRRKFQSQLLNPTTNIDWLTSEYSIIEKMLLPENIHYIDLFRKQVGQIRDIEKVCRQLVIKKVYPSTLYQLHNSIRIIQQLNMCLFENKDICNYLCNEIVGNKDNQFEFINNSCLQMIQFLEKMLFIENCKNINSVNSFDENIIQTGVSSRLDEIINEHNNKMKIFTEVKNRLNIIMKFSSTNNADTEYVKIHETDKSGLSLQITKTRANAFKQIIKKMIESPGENISKITLTNPDFEMNLKDIKFVSSTNSCDEIQIPELDKICKDLLTAKDKINTIIAETYFEILDKLEKDWFSNLENLANYVAKIDVLQCKAYVAKMYKYCKPEIVDNGSPKSFVNAVELRHCLIEHIQQNEIYVTNDLCIGSQNTENISKDGILLYGTNAVGKTSLIRALGICIIMAQSGMFVPCSRFLYKPYHSIYSRILGNDNIFKGLSTFAVEMSELRIILKMADENSLILGDELCSGTETESALSIFVAGLMELHEKQASFIFATHFHEIIHYDEVKSLNRLSLNHMSVIYDREKDCLVYDRKLKEGAGTRTYGLEVCKSLYLTDEFLDKAYAIRNKYYPETKGELTQNTSRYNAEKIRGFCEMCKERLGEEVHHLQQQKDADEDGFIGTFHKNHKANLLTVCESCHNKLHSANETNNEVAPKQKKKTTKGYTLV